MWSGSAESLTGRHCRQPHTCYRRCLNYLEMCNRLPPPRHPHSCESAVSSKQSITVTYWDPLPPPAASPHHAAAAQQTWRVSQSVGYHQRSIPAGVFQHNITYISSGYSVPLLTRSANCCDNAFFSILLCSIVYYLKNKISRQQHYNPFHLSNNILYLYVQQWLALFYDVFLILVLSRIQMVWICFIILCKIKSSE